jgi:hypothetical protein
LLPLTRILTLAAAAALVALTATSNGARADKSAQAPNKPILATVGQVDLSLQPMSECHLHRRAISRVACKARLGREMHNETVVPVLE